MGSSFDVGFTPAGHFALSAPASPVLIHAPSIPAESAGSGLLIGDSYRLEHESPTSLPGSSGTYTNEFSAQRADSIAANAHVENERDILRDLLRRNTAVALQQSQTISLLQERNTALQTMLAAHANIDVAPAHSADAPHSDELAESAPKPRTRGVKYGQRVALPQELLKIKDPQERRKQIRLFRNRDSALRSRLRRSAEVEDLKMQLADLRTELAVVKRARNAKGRVA